MKADVTYRIIGCAMEVHRALGAGLYEKPYENALVVELGLSGIRVDQQVRFPIRYKDRIVGEYIADLVVDRDIVVEAKAIKEIGESEVAQTLNYMRLAGSPVGLILNFRNGKLETKRLSL